MCGIVGVYNSATAAYDCYLGLLRLQHRGEEGAGIAAMRPDKSIPDAVKGQGFVENIFDDATLRGLEGQVAIAGNRYSTVRSDPNKSIQPLKMRMRGYDIATAHNGNIANFPQLRASLEDKGAIFESDLDSQIFTHLIAHAKGGTIEERIKDSFPALVGAYSLLIMADNKLIAVRDPNGFRPLHLGKRKETYIVASETSVFDLTDAQYVREIAPGEILTIDENGLHSDSLPIIGPVPRTFCIFEHIYFSRPDSMADGSDAYAKRYANGRRLAQEKPVPGAQVIAPVPDSGTPAGWGYSAESGVPLENVFVRTHNTGRTFIIPPHRNRFSKVKSKLNVRPDTVRGRVVVIVDDSTVRGTTSKGIVALVRKAGAKEVHYRVASPPIFSPCYYGMDFPTKDELIVNQLGLSIPVTDTTRIAQFIGADSFEYLSLEGLLVSTPGEGYCHACFSGQYPTQTQF